MKTVAITGASGFLGRNLTIQLELLGFDVIAIPRDWTTIPKADYYIVCGAYGNMYDQTDRQETFRVNVQRTFDFLEAVKDIPYQKFVFISTSSVLLPTQTIYSSTKLAAEMMTNLYPHTIRIRPFSLTGVGEQSQHLIPTLIDASFTGKTIDFVPDPTHDFIDIKDFCEMLIRLMLEEKAKGTYDIGSGMARSNQEVKDLVEVVTGKKINIKIKKSMRNYDTENWPAAVRSSSKRSLLDTIKYMVEDYLNNGAK